MGTISARVPDELEEEFERYLEEENLDRSTGIRKLLLEGLVEWRQERALELLEQGEVSFSRAAALAQLSVWDFAQLSRRHDVMWVSDEHLEDDLTSL